MSDTLTALFNPGDSQVNVSLPIIVDQIFEPTERLRLSLTIPDEFSNHKGRLLIKPGSNDVAEGEIIDSNGVYNSMHGKFKSTNCIYTYKLPHTYT